MVRNQDEDGPSGKPMMATPGRRLRAVLVSREFWLIVLIAIGVSWRLTRYFLNFPIFGDEAVVGLNILDRSYFGLLRPLRYIVACPIGFLWMSKYVMGHLGTSSYAVRLVPLLASLMSIPCMYLIARKFAGRWVAQGLCRSTWCCRRAWGGAFASGAEWGSKLVGRVGWASQAYSIVIIGACCGERFGRKGFMRWLYRPITIPAGVVL